MGAPAGGYRRFEGVQAAAALARLYASAPLFVNFFQPSFKLAAKQRDGARVRKRCHAPATPYQRVLADPRTAAAVRRRLSAIYADLDPVLLLRQVREWQQRLIELADAPVEREAGAVSPVSLEQFLTGLRTAWQAGEVRPTARLKVGPKRERRRPDPFAAVTLDLRSWFEAEPSLTGRELLERLQAEHPGPLPRSPAADAAAAAEDLAGRDCAYDGVRGSKLRLGVAGERGIVTGGVLACRKGYRRARGRRGRRTGASFQTEQRTGR